MGPDDTLDEALRGLAGHARQTGRLAAVAEVRRRGDIRRRRRHVATAALGVVLLGALGAGATVVQLGRAPHATLPAGPSEPTPTPSATAESPAVEPTGTTPGGAQSSSPVDPLRLGQRQYAVIRSSSEESAVSLLDDGKLGEVDGDEGRRLFVFVPQESGGYLIRTAEPDAKGDRACWQVRSAGTASLTIVAAACSPTEPRQLFSIDAYDSKSGQRTYSISNNSAFLQYFSRSGLILEELGDASLTTEFRFVDNGPAPPQ
ncbi:hypothetical protein ACIG87_01940 [Micromonospora sp. NPDC051925]|uniref:hypothetical protein n=1 Tax=Micromonospora sp. NPDC051925 TaxID=3364288 RepID=UPI0037C98F51